MNIELYKKKQGNNFFFLFQIFSIVYKYFPLSILYHVEKRASINTRYFEICGINIQIYIFINDLVQ